MISDDYKKAKESKSLDSFLCRIELNNAFDSSTEKAAFLELLLKDLQKSKEDWSEQLKTRALSVVRTLGRDPVGSDPLFTSEGITTLVSLAGLSAAKDTTSSREALKCIANCIYLKDTVKPILEQEHVLDACLHVLQSEDHLSLDTQFLTCRILFFLTVHRLDLVQVLIKEGLASTMEKVLASNIALLEDSDCRSKIDPHLPINPWTVTGEALKLLFNTMLLEGRDGKDASGTFKSCLVPILRLVFRVPFAEPQPLVPPHSQAIHALMQFQYTEIAEAWTTQTDLYGKDPQDAQGYQLIASTLVSLLDRAIHILLPSGDPDVDGNQSIDGTIAPVLLVILCLSEGNKAIGCALAKSMLPHEKDRLVPVHEGTSLPAYLIRLMTSTMMPQSRDAVCETLFVLCDKDANKFSQQVGYGNAVGFLLNKGIPMETPPEHSSGPSINPITGQYVSQEKEPDLKDMTDEEKEREAERLFVLFERLKKTGIIDVENPIAKAMQESQGRFQEVDSDSDSD